MELELHQLTLRFERLRKRQPREERSLLVSLSEIGQQLPVVVIQEAPSFVLIDGYKRVRALKALGPRHGARDLLAVAEAEALLLERGLRRGERGRAGPSLVAGGVAGALPMVARGTGAALRTQQELGERPVGAPGGVADIDPRTDPRRQHQCARGDEVSGAARARTRRRRRRSPPR